MKHDHEPRGQHRPGLGTTPALASPSRREAARGEGGLAAEAERASRLGQHPSPHELRLGLEIVHPYHRVARAHGQPADWRPCSVRVEERGAGLVYRGRRMEVVDPVRPDGA